MAKKLIDLVGITKSYGDKVILDDMNLFMNENRFLTLLGPSGCGKTTTLRIIGGFETPDRGKVIFDGKDITNMPPNERNLNTVFQKYALFTHMNIEENIAFGLKIKNKSKSYIKDKIKYALKLVNLDGFEKRMPDLAFQCRRVRRRYRRRFKIYTRNCMTISAVIYQTTVTSKNGRIRGCLC